MVQNTCGNDKKIVAEGKGIVRKTRSLDDDIRSVVYHHRFIKCGLITVKNRYLNNLEAKLKISYLWTKKLAVN